MIKSKRDLVSNFLSGIGAAHNLLVDAIELNVAFTEQVCLCATLIDGILRLSLVMEEQLETGKEVVDSKLLFQGKRQKKFISEREIYCRARQKRIITKEIERKLNLLYNRRNIIIHRYLISDIKTKDVIKVAKQYIDIYLKIKERHRSVHNKLVHKKIGIAKHFIENPSVEQIQEQILKKHI